MLFLCSLSPHLSSDTCCTDICSCSFPLFPSLSFKRSLCRFSTVCLPVCLQGPVTQISALALFPSFPLSLSRDPYVGSPLSVSPSVFIDLLLRSVRLLFSPLPLSFFRDFYVGSLLSVSPSVFRDLLLRSLFLLSSSLPHSLFQEIPM